ncbi:CPBP family intramembrane glutamic endopeptidase [Paenibacillus contaminans]|uniref:CPBP family intramembrane metalloprotease domain-containing protein n=1 Tax=Paenibacillus contaminans TaxID=450362 RepID=A0A329MR71_9BACL|nr:type II CAAX endopeptidase family protein [Paenibacillus contaminans]RAV22435.1 CPBP family intramembrane metalloprotease domain-containing protein [Paenibacillus contaminans]
MVPHKLNRQLLLLAVIGIVLYVSVMAYNMIANSSSVEEDFALHAVTKTAAADAAVKFVETKFPGVTPSGTRVLYESDQELSGYLQKSGLYDEYESAYGQRFPLDYWQVDVKTRTSDTVYTVYVGMEKPEIAGWRKTAAARKAPPTEDGAKIAAASVIGMGYKADEFVYNANDKTGRGEKPDSTLYTFESTQAKIGEAKLLLQVNVQSGETVSFKPAFSVPSDYLSWLGKQQKSASWMTMAHLVFTVVMGIVALVYMIMYARHISFSRGIVMTLVYAAAYIVQTFNMIPALQTQSPDQDQVVMVILLSVSILFVLLSAASVYMSLLAGDALWRQKNKHLWPRWSESDFGAHIFYAMGRGYLICLFIMGVQQVVFFAAEKGFHAFGVNDPMQSPLNMLWPGLFPTLAWLAGISEEILFRLFGIIIFKKLLRNTFLAILIPNVFWALGHTGYTIYPSYTRLIEVTLLGFIFGYVFLKYGLYTAIYAHVAMDSILMAFSYIASENTAESVLVGLFYAALPAIVGYAIMLLHARLKPKRPQPEFVPPGAT